VLTQKKINYMKRFSAVLLTLLIVTFACERKNNGTSKDEKESKVEVVKKNVDSIVDSVNGAWNAMIQQDDQKFKDVKRLLDEISYTSSYDVVAHDSLLKKLEVIKSKRFDQNLDTTSIDNYYALTDKFILEVFQLKAKTKGIEQHPIADELVEDITRGNSTEAVSQSLSKYNYWTNQFNTYIKKNHKQLEKLGDPYTSLKEKPVLYKL
jgi:hypothetical protein